MKLSIISFVVILLSCSIEKNQNSEDFDRFNKFLNLKKITTNTVVRENKAILFIPVEGCETCVSKCVIFMKNNKKKFSVILGATRKEIKSFIKKNSIDLKGNLFIDNDATSLKIGVYSGFPYILYLDNEMNVKRHISLNVLNIDKELDELKLFQ